MQEFPNIGPTGEGSYGKKKSSEMDNSRGPQIDLATLRARSEDDFDAGALKAVLVRVDETAVPPEEFGRLVEAAGQVA